MPEDDLTQIPTDPPGNPEGGDPPKKVDAAPTSFSTEQTTAIVREAVRGVITELTPKPNLTPSGPVGPTSVELDNQINVLDDQIDLAVESGDRTKIRALTKQRDSIRDQKFDLEHVAPLRSQGSSAINDLVLNQMAADSELGEIFKEYRTEVMEALKVGIQQGTALRLDWVKEATRMVAGRHLGEITDRRYEEKERQRKLKENPPAPLPGSTNGRGVRAGQDREPDTIIEQFGPAGDAAFRHKQNTKGYDEDQFARRMGFRDKKDWFAKDRELAANPTLGLDR